MRNPKDNTIVRVFSLTKELMKKTWQSLRSLLLGEKGNKDSMLYSVFDLIFKRGPQSFRKNPRAISIGRGIIAPLALIFSSKKTK